MARAKKVKESLEPKEQVKEYKDSDILKCEIGKAFTDKYTDKLYEVGKVYEFTFKRVKEIKAKNEKYLKIIEK